LRSDGFQNEFERLSERLCLLPSKDIQKKRKTETPEKSKYKLADSKTKCNKTKQKNKGKHFFVVHLRKNRLLNARCNRNNNKSSTTKSLKKSNVAHFLECSSNCKENVAKIEEKFKKTEVKT